MRKNFIRTLVSAISVCILVFITSSYRKTDHKELDPQTEPTEIPLNSVAKFLTLPATIHPSLKKVADHTRNENKRSAFLERFIKKEGFTIWDKAL